ncbi:10426_t:CDS:10, partial [Paraglomus occultum]
DHGVEKIHYLQQTPIVTELKSLIYMCRPQLQYMKYIADHIRNHQLERANSEEDGQKYEYHLYFVPRRTMICQRVLEEKEYHLDLIPFEDDVLSLELDNSFKELYLDGDYTAIYYAARALMELQKEFGLFPRIIGKGDCAKQLADMLIRMRRERAVDDPVSAFSVSPSIDTLIIIDRQVDQITPLCTQLTYEGLIDEVFGIKTTVVELDSSIVGPPPQRPTATATSTASSSTASQAPPPPPAQPAAKKKKVALNSSDKLFGQLRDVNFAVVGGMLNRVARRINEDYEVRHQARTVAQVREFVNKLGGLQSEHQSLRMHTGIAEEIMTYTVTPEFNRTLEVQQNLVAGIDVNTQNEYIEEMINRQIPLTYGFEHLQTLINLEKLNLFIKQQSTKNPYKHIRQFLKLIVDEVDEHNPQDISYVYSGYAPLSVRLIQCIVTKGGPNALAHPTHVNAAIGAGNSTSGMKINGWKGYEEVLRLLPGKSFDEIQKIDDGVMKSRRAQQPRVTLVFFLGGCTYTEISAVRFLNQQDEDTPTESQCSVKNTRSLSPSEHSVSTNRSFPPAGTVHLMRVGILRREIR